MIEIPESHTLTDQLNRTIAGKEILNVVAGDSPHKFAFFNGDPADYHDMLSGLVVERAVAHGGRVVLEMGDMRLSFNDGVAMRLIQPGEKLPPKHQLLIEFGDHSHIVCTVRMYAGLLAFKEGELENWYHDVSVEKPTPLTDAFDKEYFEAIFTDEKPTLSAKAMLATEQRIPGLGNGVLHDILFNARIHPKRKLSTLGAEDMDRLFACVKNTLLDMTLKGGRDTEKDLFGDAGGYATLLSPKTYKQPCPVCGGEIVRQAYMGGNVYFCPECQKL